MRPSTAIALAVVVSLTGGCSKEEKKSDGAAAASASAAAPTHAPKETRDAPLEPGDEVPPFDALTQTGMRASVERYRGRPLVLVFQASVTHRDSRDRIVALRDAWFDLRKYDTAVLVISADGTPRLSELSSKLELPFLLGTDPDLAIARAYGIPGADKGAIAPTVYVIGRDGRVAAVVDQPGGKLAADILGALKALPEPKDDGEG